MNKRLILPVIAFFVLMLVGINSLLEGIAQHETWRIIEAFASIGFSVIAAVVGVVGLYRNRHAVCLNHDSRD